MADLDVKDFTLGTAKTIKTTTIAAKEYPNHIIVDDTGINVIKLEDAASASGDPGVVALVKRAIAPANTSGTDGDYEPLQASAGQLWVNSGLYQPGTNGFLASAFLLIGGSGATNGLDGLTSGAAATGGSTFTQSDTKGARYGEIFYLSGDTTWTPNVAGACFSGWFLRSGDGANFEDLMATPSTTVSALPRAPDFVIPLDNGVAFGIGGKRKFATSPVLLPSGSFKVVVQNNAGATTGDTVTTHAGIYCAPLA